VPDYGSIHWSIAAILSSAYCSMLMVRAASI
jgi:hypothetical protein